MHSLFRFVVMWKVREQFNYLNEYLVLCYTDYSIDSVPFNCPTTCKPSNTNIICHGGVLRTKSKYPIHCL